jgi:hypothetical protein
MVHCQGGRFECRNSRWSRDRKGWAYRMELGSKVVDVAGLELGIVGGPK